MFSFSVLRKGCWRIPHLLRYGCSQHIYAPSLLSLPKPFSSTGGLCTSRCSSTRQNAEHDTIYSIASGSSDVRSPVVVYRISGKQSLQMIERLTQKKAPEKRKAVVRDIFAPATGELVDKSVVLYFKGPNSFTGEDVAEIHGHGGRAMAKKMMEVFGECANAIEGVRHAERGEFSRRAFLNDKMDLSQAEGLCDLITAETDAQRVEALKEYSGAISERFNGWRKEIVQAMGRLVALIDFGEDEEIDDDSVMRLEEGVRVLVEDMRRQLGSAHKGERLRSGVKLVICGPPNVGKSSLINILARRQAAIVSPTAGTTRDVIEVHFLALLPKIEAFVLPLTLHQVQLDIGGYPVLVADTAGLRTSEDDVELQGIALALERMKEADIKLFMIDSTKVESESDEIFEQMDSSSLLLYNKRDLLSSVCRDCDCEVIGERADCGLQSSKPLLSKCGGAVLVSCESGANLDQFIDILENSIKSFFENGESNPEDVLLARDRHRVHLERTVDLLNSFIHSSEPIEIRCESLRQAAMHLGAVTGGTSTENVLDEVFLEFCIGK